MEARSAKFVDAALPFTLEVKKKEKTLETYYNKKGKTGDVIRYCIDNNVEPTIDICRMFDKVNASRMFKQIMTLQKSV